MDQHRNLVMDEGPNRLAAEGERGDPSVGISMLVYCTLSLATAF